MKKTIKLFTVLSVAFTILFCSCTSSIERKAKKEMKRKMTEVAKIPESVKITNLNTVYVDDSLCVLHYDFAGKNSYGAVVKNREEFIYLVDEDGSFAYYHDIDDNESVLEKAKETYQESLPKMTEERYKELLVDEKKREEFKRACIKLEVSIKCLVYGYEVGKKNESDSEYNIKNW